jgi:hypothetical protein
VDSLDQNALLRGAESKPLRTEVVEQGISGAIALRAGGWKFIPTNKGQSVSGMGSGADPRDTRWAESIVPADALYNLTEDPAEKNNLATKMPAKAEELRKRLQEIRSAR